MAELCPSPLVRLPISDALLVECLLGDISGTPLRLSIAVAPSLICTLRRIWIPSDNSSTIAPRLCGPRSLMIGCHLGRTDLPWILYLLADHLIHERMPLLHRLGLAQHAQNVLLVGIEQ